MSDPVEDGDSPRWGLIFLLALVGLALLAAMGAVWFVSNPNFKLPFPLPGRHAEPPPQPPPKPVRTADGHLLANPDWRRRPTGEDVERYYPGEAARRHIAGSVVIDCKVARDGRLVGCRTVSETPPGWGFGDAAIAMAGRFRMYPKTIDGQATDEGEVRVPINFQPGR